MTTRAHKRFTPSQATLLRNWIEALRSGYYEQGSGGLLRRVSTDHKYCCLGVACDVHSAMVGGYWNESNERTRWGHLTFVLYPDRDDHGEESTLPTDVRIRFGLFPSEVSALIKLNDGGISFEDIANRLEHCLTTGEKLERWFSDTEAKATI